MATDTIAALRRVPIFASLSDDGLSHIAAVSTEFEAPAGQVLIDVGQPGTGLFIIEEGSVRVELAGGETIERGPGEFFGELAVLTDTPRTARVAVANDLRCLAIRRNDMTNLLDQEPAIAAAMLRELARRLAESI